MFIHWLEDQRSFALGGRCSDHRICRHPRHQLGESIRCVLGLRLEQVAVGIESDLYRSVAYRLNEGSTLATDQS